MPQTSEVSHVHPWKGMLPTAGRQAPGRASGAECWKSDRLRAACTVWVTTSWERQPHGGKGVPAAGAGHGRGLTECPGSYRAVVRQRCACQTLPSKGEGTDRIISRGCGVAEAWGTAQDPRGAGGRAGGWQGALCVGRSRQPGARF